METLGFFPKRENYFNPFTENFNNSSKLLDGKTLPLNQINDGSDSLFKFKFQKKKLYLVNDNYRIPCSVPIKNRLLIFIYYIPVEDDSIYIDESYYDGREIQISLDVMFYVDYVHSLNKSKKFKFLSHFNLFLNRTLLDKYFLNRLIYECGFDEFTKNELYYKYNTLGVVSSLLIHHNFKYTLDMSRLYQKMTLIDVDPFGFNFRFSNNTFEIESKQKFFSSFFQNFLDISSVKLFFEIDQLRESLNEFLNLDDSSSFEIIKHIEKTVFDNYSVKNPGGLLTNPRKLKHLSKEQKRPYLFIKNYKKKISVKLRELENIYRSDKGYNVVGTLVSESILFTKIKEEFKEYKVVSQGSPSWLNRQRIDIYFPELNIGVEYQGIQHFKPVEFFGGLEGFVQTQERDKRKRNLCKKHGCVLIFVLPNYKIDEVIHEIHEKINNLK